MNEQPQPTTEQVHGNLKNILLNGRILVNGLPLTANEIASIIQGEQMLFEKAMKFDQAVALAAKKQEEEAKKQAEEEEAKRQAIAEEKRQAIKLADLK